MLGSPNSDRGRPAGPLAAEVDPAPVVQVLEAASAAAYDRFAPHPVASDHDGRGWLAVDALISCPDDLYPLVESAGRRRFLSDDRPLVLAQVARESIAALTAAAVHTWSRQRRLLDLDASNVLLRDGEVAVVAGLARPLMHVLPDDPLAGRPDTHVLDEATMFDRLAHHTLGQPQPRPPRTENQKEPSAITAIVAAARHLATSGERPLWGSVALGVANTLTACSHTTGGRADEDRTALLAARPDLARTIELVTTSDHGDPAEPISFAVRLTCCLRYKLPDALQCGTCSLRDRATCTADLADWHRDRRHLIRNGG